MRKIIILFSTLCVLLLLAFCGYRGYSVWKQSHWLAMAKSFAAKGDVANEMLSLQAVLRVNSKNLDASKMIADLNDEARASAALPWRQRVLQLEPNLVDNRLALAETAIVMHELGIASDALANVPAAAKQTPGYLMVAGEFALALNKADDAQADFAQAARLDPSNPIPQLRLASLELLRTNDLDLSEGRLILKRMSLSSTNSLVRRQANRLLVVDALRFKDYNTAVSLSTELAQGTNAMFGDRLLYLESLKTSKNSLYPATLSACENESGANPEKLRQLTLWLVDQGLHEHALAWLQGMSANVRTNQPAALLIAQCQMVAGDWTTVQKSISKQTWRGLEFTRHAYIARALREQGLEGASKAEWDVAFKSADNQLGALKALYNLSTAWRWPGEAQQLLWAIVKAYPKEQWADLELGRLLYASGSTRSLMELFRFQYTRNPANLDAGNNLAYTAMLLRSTDCRPYDLAHDIYVKVPTNGTYACTYALALYWQNRKEEALRIMQGLDAKCLENNSTAGYYGLILKSVGEKSKAVPYLRRSITGAGLPEERALFQGALAGL